ncbi:hypothetical protein FNV43_RR04767 [Rhamnella rubrinervis]|uniref:Uncharacterized protein n=1 Tax=Rhamnella rubrinervis TaxID=2594499 RepID=A0A8K0HMF0_9ROSA|nr:hypothetical protein FNV43_RR04767 [Rhamnella rubrinervis]
MHSCYRRGIRLLSSASSSRSKIKWDPTVALELNHETLYLLEKCSTRYHFKQILGHMMRTRLIGLTFPMSRLLLFSAISHPENLDMAILLFNYYTPCPNLFIYNTMISALSFSTTQSFALYNSMLHSGICPDKHTLLYLLKASYFISQVKQIHGHAIVTGLFSYVYLKNSLTKKYLEKGLMGIARQVFIEMTTPDSVSFNIMIVGYGKEGFGLEAMEMFHEMVHLGLKPDDFTMLGLLVSCGLLRDAQLGKSVHAWIERRNSSSSSNLILGNALLDMYVKCGELGFALKAFNALLEKDTISWNTMIAGYAKVGELELALTLFNQMPTRDLVSWNSLIAGFVKKGDYVMVMNLFNSMVAENVRPDSVTMVCLVSTAAEIGTLDQGQWIHGLVVRMEMKIDEFLGSALIDMYCKCGSIERALLVLRGLTKKDVTIWTTMITGLAFHGYGRKALDLFLEMQRDVIPNEVTFVAVLTACSHSGFVNEGLTIFDSMKLKFGIQPGIEHYGCLVDLLARSGMLKEAKDVIERMPMKPSQTIWGSVLSACRARGNVELAEFASKELLKLEPEKEGGYVLLSNTYAACGRWSYSDKIREVMEIKGVRKSAGCSSVVVDGLIHDFVVADKRHPRWVDIRWIIQCLKSEMRLDADYSEINCYN